MNVIASPGAGNSTGAWQSVILQVALKILTDCLPLSGRDGPRQPAHMLPNFPACGRQARNDG